MSSIETLCLVLAAVYALTCVLLSIGVALIWHAGLERRRSRPGELLTLRLLPAFIISAKQVREFLGIFEEVLGHVSKSMAATETARLAAHSAAR